jgi:adenosylcobinamide-GDP ribazoletransferase
VKFLAALRFLTVVPIALRREATAAEVGASIVYFPLVGAVIGLALAGTYWVLARFLPLSMANALILVGMVLVNGALHMDGFIDTCDGLAGNKPPEERQRIMKDSRVGAFGVVGGVLLLLLKFVSFNSIPQDVTIAGLVMMPVISRWLMVYAIVAYPYAKSRGLGTVFKQEATWNRFWAATIIAAVAVAAALWWRGVNFRYFSGAVAMVGVWVAALAWLQHLSRKFGGLTGDSYGSVCEFSEVAILMALSLLVHNRWLWIA